MHKTDDAKLAAPNAKALVVKDGSQDEVMALFAPGLFSKTTTRSYGQDHYSTAVPVVM